MLSSMRSRSRLPDRLWRSPMQTSCRSANGWKGCVTRTSCAETTAWSAFAVELQASGERPFVWPPIVEGALHLTSAQLALLIEGIDWPRTAAPEAPERPSFL